MRACCTALQLSVFPLSFSFSLSHNATTLINCTLYGKLKHASTDTSHIISVLLDEAEVLGSTFSTRDFVMIPKKARWCHRKCSPSPDTAFPVKLNQHSRASERLCGRKITLFTLQHQYLSIYVQKKKFWAVLRAVRTSKYRRIEKEIGTLKGQAYTQKLSWIKVNDRIEGKYQNCHSIIRQYLS